jgi:hypothetical protein
MNHDEDFADLIKSQVKLDWGELKAELPEMPTDVLIAQMVELRLYVNKTLALEIARRKDAVFHVRRILQDGRYWYTELKDFGEAWAPIHAIHILAMIKSREALELLLDVIRYRGEDLSDWLTESVPYLLVAFGEDAIPLLKEFTEDESLEAFARGTGATALAKLAKKFPSREVEIKLHLTKQLNTTNDATFGALVASELAEFQDPSVLPDIRKAFAGGRIDESMYTEDDIEMIVNGAYADLDEERFRRYTQDPANHFSRENIEFLHSVEYGEKRNEQTKSKKVGRNDPCPCGSGKKYKKCCWPKTFGAG